MYEYKCFTMRVIDGNTIDAEIDLGFNVLVRQRIKLHGIDCPDIRSNDPATKERAQQARSRLVELVGKQFYCNTIMNKRGKIGRTLGHVYTMDSNDSRVDINQTLIDDGFANRYGD